MIIDMFSEEQLIKQVKDIAKKNYPNVKPFESFMSSITEGLYDQFKGIEITPGTVISHAKINVAARAFWEEYQEMKNAKGKDYRGNFVMMYRGPFSSVSLTSRQHEAIAKLYTTMQYDGYLTWKDAPMGREEIGDFLGYEDTSHGSSFRRRVLSPICQQDILTPYTIQGMGKKLFYRFNPSYVFKGKAGPGEHFLKVFQTMLRRVITAIEEEESRYARLAKRKKLNSAVGTLHALLPYVHYQTLHFTKRPTENILEGNESIQDAIDREAVKKYRKKHLLLSKPEMRRAAAKGNKEGLNKKDFERHITILKDLGILYSEESGGSSNYILFPLLAFSHIGDGKDEYTCSVIKKFYKTWGANRDRIIKRFGLEDLTKHFDL